MKASAIWAAASLFAATLGFPAHASRPGVPAATSAALIKALMGKAIPSAELGREHGRGLSVNVNGSALNNANSTNNSVIDSPITGSIENDHSISNNVGITSVLQNLGNNSVLQSSTTINISVH